MNTYDSHDSHDSLKTYNTSSLTQASTTTNMIATAFIIAFLAGNALVEAVPAKQVSTYSYPETITITPPTTTKTLIWPSGLFGLPGTTTVITSTLYTFGPHLQPRETAGDVPVETAATTQLWEEAVSALPIPSNDTQIFVPIEVSASANFTSTAVLTPVRSSALTTGKTVDSRAPLPEKTVFITITKEPAKSSSVKPKPT